MRSGIRSFRARTPTGNRSMTPSLQQTRNRPSAVRKHRALMLLEVVLALALLLIAITMVGVAFSNSDRNARNAVDKSRALMLTEQIVTRFDTGQFQDERDVSGQFGDEGPPGWAWTLKKEKDNNVEGMERVTLRIIEGDPSATADEQRPILTTYFLRAEKKNLNLMEDFGLSEEDVSQLTDAIPGGAAVLDPADFDPTSLARLDMETLQQMLPMIMQTLAAQGGANALSGSLNQLQSQAPRLPQAVSPENVESRVPMSALQPADASGNNTDDSSDRPARQPRSTRNPRRGGNP